ncbi:MAG: FecR family protein [Betaproteobacteria bacterium]|nr:FecR family protein [Betaproteobacteria bacterium]
MNESSVSIFRKKKFLLPFFSAAIAMSVGALIFILPPPLSTQLYETTADQYQRIELSPVVSVELDENSSITVTNSEPPRVEIIQGNTYFSGNSSSAKTNRLEIITGNVRFWDMGANFSLQTINNSSNIAINSGQLEMIIGDQSRLVLAGQRIDFDNNQVIEESSVVGLEIAPWRRALTN